jgi:hypothetical protein
MCNSNSAFSASKVIDWYHMAKVGDKNRFSMMRFSAGGVTLDVEKIEHEGTVGVRYRKAVGNQGASWFAGSIGHLIDYLIEMGH